MEERSNNITHTNDENKDQSSDQNVCCDICARSFRTNCGLLRRLNFCQQRNIHEGDNLNGNIQTNHINHDHLNDNEVFEINNATNLVRTIKMKIRSTSIGMMYPVRNLQMN